MFDFNQYSSLLLIGVIPALLHTALLFVRAWREERWSDFLAGCILVVGVLYVTQWMLGFAGWYNQRDWRTTIMFYVQWDHLIAFGPLCWLYFRAVTNTDFQWQRSYWLHFLPWLLLVLPHLSITFYDWVVVRLLNGEAFTFFGDTRGPAMDWVHVHGGYPGELVFAFIRLALIVYLLFTVRDYRRYRRYLEEEFSNTDQLTLSGHGYLLGLLLLGVSLTIFIEAINLFSTQADYTDAWFSYFTMSVLLLFAGVQFYAVDTRLTRSLRFQGAAAGAMREQKEQGRVPKAMAAAPASAQVSSPPDTSAEDIAWSEKLNHYLEEYPAHLNPELKLGDLAKELGTNASVLSRVINTSYQQNFNDFINARRCAAFLERVRAGEHHRHTLLSLALDSGFNSKSTFNRAFRKHYGKSPKAAVEESER
ncbi:helix-turn-helix domain-containing protein [Neolewinella persica]|uniref:helix-turn-helix domain-containing protein n=1 Tax=Neolewinella persica TaxID=70998 RepID=UPI00037B91CB|nr:helix-turn-helix domain-containing protein [Neolewinella persica]